MKLAQRPLEDEWMTFGLKGGIAMKLKALDIVILFAILLVMAGVLANAFVGG